MSENSLDGWRKSAKEISVFGTDATVDLTAEVGGYVWGEYGGYKEVETKLGATRLHLVRLRETKLKSGLNRGEIVSLCKGLVIGIWGTGQLDAKLKGVAQGSLVYVEYLGTEVLKGYPNPLHNFLVQV